MGYYDAYNAILSVSSPNPRDRNVDISKRAITSTFRNNPSYYQVQLTTASTPLSSTPVDSWIVDDPNKVFEVKQISLIPDIQLNYGDLISWLGDYWLTTTVDYMGNIYYRGSMSKCYSSIKWQDSTLTTKEAYFTITKDSQRGLGILDGREMILANERRFVAIQNNVDTIKIVKGQRFILDNGRCFRTTSIDTLKTGIIGLELEETQIDTVLDNVSLRICNYQIPKIPPVIPAGTLFISGVDSIKVTQSTSYQSFIDTTLAPVYWELHDITKTTTTTLATITSFDNTSCTLRANSNNQYGSVQLKATLQSDATKFYWLKVDVKALF